MTAGIEGFAQVEPQKAATTEVSHSNSHPILPAPPNDPLRDPKYHKTIRPLMEVHWRVRYLNTHRGTLASCTRGFLQMEEPEGPKYTKEGV